MLRDTRFRLAPFDHSPHSSQISALGAIHVYLEIKNCDIYLVYICRKVQSRPRWIYRTVYILLVTYSKLISIHWRCYHLSLIAAFSPHSSKSNIVSFFKYLSHPILIMNCCDLMILRNFLLILLKLDPQYWYCHLFYVWKFRGFLSLPICWKVSINFLTILYYDK